MLDHKLVLIRIMSPTSCGAGSGSAEIDSPTLLEATTGLPCLPATTLKGIWKAGTTDPIQCKDLHGEPDSDALPGRESSAQLGEAFLISIPIPACGGSYFWAASALHLARLFALHRTITLAENSQELLSLIEGAEGFPGSLIHSVPEGVQLIAYNGTRLRNSIPTMDAGRDGLIQKLGEALPARWGFHDGRPLAILPSSQIKELVQLALDERTSTALNGTGVAKAASLRKAQLIPQDSVFASVLTGRADAPQPDRLCIGSGESTGWGWIEIRG